MWKIGGEGAARYPGIGMSSLARNFALIVVSYLFAWISCSRFPFYSFFLLPFSRFLLAVDTCFRVFLSRSLVRRDNSSFNARTLSFSGSLLILIQRRNSLLPMSMSPVISQQDERSGNAFHSSTYVSPNSHVAGDYDKLHSFSEDNAPRGIMRACAKCLSRSDCASVRMLFSMHAD